MIQIDTMKFTIEYKYGRMDSETGLKLFSKPYRKQNNLIARKMHKIFLLNGIEKLELVTNKNGSSSYEIKLSSKILGNRYPEGIIVDNIDFIINEIYTLSGLKFEREGWDKAQVHILHIVKNCLFENPKLAMDCINSIQITNYKYRVDGIGGTSILFQPRAAYKKVDLNMYLKYPELMKTSFKSELDDEGLEWAKKNLRTELRLIGHKWIKQYFGSITLGDILSSKENPIIDVFEAIFDGIEPKFPPFVPSTTQELFKVLFIEKHKRDICSIRRELSATVSASNLSRTTKSFSLFLGEMESAKLVESSRYQYFQEIKRQLRE